MISFAFDDGWKNHYTRAIPILEKYNFKATFYVITRMPEYMLKEGEGRMSKSEWKGLYDNGHEVGAHSQTHPNFNISFPWTLYKEIFNSKKDLENLGIHVSTFAYPYGKTGLFSSIFLRRAGYLGARVYDNNFSSPLKNPYKISTKNVYNSTTLDEVVQWIDATQKNNEWLILTFHQIEAHPQKWGSTPEFFEKVCSYVHDRKCEVVTVSEGIVHFGSK